MTAQELLVELEGLSEQMETLKHERDLESLRIVPEDLAARLLEIDDVYNERMEDVQASYKAIEKQLKAAVVQRGQTVTGTKFAAVLGGPRITWDKKGLENYMKTNQYIRKFRKVGARPVSIRVAVPSSAEEA